MFFDWTVRRSDGRGEGKKGRSKSYGEARTSYFIRANGATHGKGSPRVRRSLHLGCLFRSRRHSIMIMLTNRTKKNLDSCKAGLWRVSVRKKKKRESLQLMKIGADLRRYKSRALYYRQVP